MKVFISIALAIIIIVVAVLIYDYIQESKLVGFLEFRKNIKDEFSEIWDIGVENSSNPVIRLNVMLRKPLEKEDIELVFLKVIDYLNNEPSYNSLQNLHKRRFKYLAGTIKISFEYRKGDESIVSYYEGSTEMGGEDFTFDSFKKWRMNYNGEYLGIYELPEK